MYVLCEQGEVVPSERLSCARVLFLPVLLHGTYDWVMFAEPFDRIENSSAAVLRGAAWRPWLDLNHVLVPLLIVVSTWLVGRWQYVLVDSHPAVGHVPRVNIRELIESSDGSRRGTNATDSARLADRCCPCSRSCPGIICCGHRRSREGERRGDSGEEAGGAGGAGSSSSKMWLWDSAGDKDGGSDVIPETVALPATTAAAAAAAASVMSYAATATDSFSEP